MGSEVILGSGVLNGVKDSVLGSKVLNGVFMGSRVR